MVPLDFIAEHEQGEGGLFGASIQRLWRYPFGGFYGTFHHNFFCEEIMAST
jgi:hypothetical protein